MTRKSRHRIQQKSFMNLMFQTKLMREESFLTDVKLQCQDKEFLVHKVILSAASPYFKEQFKENSEITSLQMDFLNSKILETVLKFIYEGHIDLRNPSQLFLKDLIEASVILKIPLMYNHCLEQLLGTHLPEQLLSKWNIIEQLNSDLLKQIYLEYLWKNIKKLKTTESFLNLSFEQFNSFLSCPIVKYEDIISVILLWVKHDQVERENKINDLLKHISFHKLEESQLLKLSEEPLLRGNLLLNQQMSQEFCQELETNNFSITARKEEVELISNEECLTECEKPCKKVNVETKQNKNYEDKKLKRWEDNDFQDTFSNSIFETKSIKFSRENHSILCYDYPNSGRLCPQILEFNVNSKTWMEVDDELLEEAFITSSDYAVCSFDNYIYFFGGVDDDGEVTNYCYMLDLVKKEILEICPMWEKRSRAKAIKVHDFIYVIGGSGNNSVTCPEVNERYNIRTQSWEFIPALSGREYYVDDPVITAVGESLCLVGETNLLWLDSRSNEWYEGESLPSGFPFYPRAAIEDKGKIFIFGWRTNKIFVFDLKTNNWDSFELPGDDFQFSDVLNISEGDELQFLVMCHNKSFLYTWPDSVELISTLPFSNPKLTVIGNKPLTCKCSEIHRNSIRPAQQVLCVWE